MVGSKLAQRVDFGSGRMPSNPMTENRGMLREGEPTVVLAGLYLRAGGVRGQLGRWLSGSAWRSALALSTEWSNRLGIQLGWPWRSALRVKKIVGDSLGGHLLICG